MLYNQTVFDIEDSIDELSHKIMASKDVRLYIKCFNEMSCDSEVTKIKNDFLQAKQEFEQIESYGRYAPDFKEKRRSVRKIKRELDTHNLVKEFKLNETAFQNLLDYITFDIAGVISDEIKIDAGNPFFEFAKKGCGGHCHVR